MSQSRGERRMKYAVGKERPRKSGGGGKAVSGISFTEVVILPSLRGWNLEEERERLLLDLETVALRKDQGQRYSAKSFMINFPKTVKHTVYAFLLPFLALIFYGGLFGPFTLTTLSQGHTLNPALIRNTTAFNIPVTYFLRSDHTSQPHSPALSPSPRLLICESTFFLLCSPFPFIFIFFYAKIQWFSSTSLLPPSTLVPFSSSETYNFRTLSALWPPSWVLLGNLLV